MTSPACAGERLLAARAIFGLSQKELAEEAGVSQPLISGIERGTREATSATLSRVASSLDVPLSFFYVAPQEIPLDSLRFRKNVTAPRLVTRRVRALYSEAFRIADTLVDLGEYHRPKILAIAGGQILASPAIGDAAAATRSALLLDDAAPIPNVMRALERGGIPVAPIVPPEEYEDALTNAGHFGLSYWPGDGAPALIGYFPGHQGDRDRFTLAHELGHLVLHTHRRADDPELEANLFAGAFLMPRSRAQTALSADLRLTDYARLKAVWGISIQALIMRAHQIGVIDDARRGSLFRQLTARGWRRNEPVVVHPERPLLLRRLHDKLFEGQSGAEVAEALAVPRLILRSLIPASGQPPKVHSRGTVTAITRKS